MADPSFVIGIAGGTGAGKTTVARMLADAVRQDPVADEDGGVTRVPLDNYYRDLSHLDLAEREDVNYDHPSAFEWELVCDHLDALLSGEAIEMPQYDVSIHNRKDETVTVEPTDVVLLEGIFSLYDERVLDRLDLRVYVETDADVRIIRRIRRDVVERGRDLEGVVDQYLSTVKPMHEQFVEPTKRDADVIIPEGANRMAVELLTEKVCAEITGDGSSGVRSAWDDRWRGTSTTGDEGT
jgi:uridine kinase